MNNKNSHSTEQYNNEDQIDLSQFFKVLKERRRFIVSFTGILTLLSLVYILSIKHPLEYNITASFITADMASVAELNNSPYLEVTDVSVFKKFLNLLGLS